MDAIKLRFTRFRTHRAEVNQYETTNLRFSSQLSNWCDVTMPSPHGEFRIIVRYEAFMKQYVYSSNLFQITGIGSAVCIGDVS